MNELLTNEINEEIAILINSGFYSEAEILEIIEEQFIDEDISLNVITDIISKKFNEKLDIEKTWKEITDFDKLKLCFDELSQNKIIAIHNAGYDIDEGIQDAFEIYHHIKTQKLDPVGFCFYHFQDIERAIESKSLSLAFGDFEGSPKKSEEIGNSITDISRKHGFIVNWNHDINTRIEINPFYWEKRSDSQEYEMEGAYNSYLKNNI
ncbi:hypothetical protein MBCUT_15580 [Methanobrevibacter cuticularis]|uniref:DUF6891 domain-containing protein n=1 Tax=Methanobrevibacter cuticularis TaxID=47311 RepID=A0A166D9F8_9EURY|nr:hypothetical protein [Methanobrevibacter cuticularis]KZX15344.1 hypothetical protein MBCUT_15580 [Methanobrevibacter cuticularis]